MRIAINGWFSDRPGTGSGQYLWGLLGALCEETPDLELLLVVPGRHSPPAPPCPSLHLWPLPSRLWRSDVGKVLFEQVAFPRACRRWGAGVAHVPYWGSPLWPALPTVVTVHDLIPLLLPAYRGGPLVRLYTRLAAAAARRAAAVLTDSLASKADIESHLRLPPDRVTAVYLAAGEGFSAEPAPGDDAIRHHYGLSGPYVLYLAGHDVRKNVAGLVEAFATVARADGEAGLAVGGRLPEQPARWSLLRGTPPHYDPRPLVEALGLQDRVRFLGWVAEEHKAALYRGASCAAFPSRYEGFGLPVLEALACGTPLVTSNAASLPELVGDAGFAVDPDDVQALAGAILACLVDRDLAAELRRRGPAQAARFTWRETARQTLEVYRRHGGQPCAS